MNINSINTAVTTPAQKSNVAFGGFADAVATGLGKVGNSDAFVKAVDKFGKSPNLMANLSTASSAVTTGLYIYKSLTNKKMDKKERLTLALNQALTFGVSTLITYTALGALKKTKANLTEKFAEAVTKRSGACADKLKQGAAAAIDLVVCSSVNRYLSPVAVTPLANKLGDMITKKGEKKEAQKA